jgi:hypothetical protein
MTFRDKIRRDNPLRIEHPANFDGTISEINDRAAVLAFAAAAVFGDVSSATVFIALHYHGANAEGAGIGGLGGVLFEVGEGGRGRETLE